MGEDIPPVRELPDPVKVQIKGEWRGELAGGCLNNIRKWRENTQYLLSAKTDVDVWIKVKLSPYVPDISVGFYLFNAVRRMVLPKKKNIYYKSKFIKTFDGVIERVRLSTEPYIFSPCTLDSGQEGSYIVEIFGDDPSITDIISIVPLPQEKEREKLLIKGEWIGNSAGGCFNYNTWINNPQYSLQITKTTELIIVLSCTSEKSELTPGFYLVHAPKEGEKVKQKTEDPIAKAAFREDNEVHKSIKLEPGRYNIIPCTYHYGQESKFEIAVWAADFGAVVLKSINE